MIERRGWSVSTRRYEMISTTDTPCSSSGSCFDIGIDQLRDRGSSNSKTLVNATATELELNSPSTLITLTNTRISIPYLEGSFRILILTRRPG